MSTAIEFLMCFLYGIGVLGALVMLIGIFIGIPTMVIQNVSWPKWIRSVFGFIDSVLPLFAFLFIVCLIALAGYSIRHPEQPTIVREASK